MLEYPENHGVGAPTAHAQAQIYYELGLVYESWADTQTQSRPGVKRQVNIIRMGRNYSSTFKWRSINCAATVRLGLEE